MAASGIPCTRRWGCAPHPPTLRIVGLSPEGRGGSALERSVA